MTAPATPGRAAVSGAVLALAALLLLLDLRAHPIDPLAAPAPAALGSGASPSGAHCTQG